MAIYKRDIVDINLETGNIHRSFLNHSIGTQDSGADHFGIRTFRDGEPVSLDGVSVQGIFMPPQGSPIAITTGNIVDGNTAEVVLPQACYNYEGKFTLAIKLVGGGVTGTIRIVDGMVDNTHASGTVAPTETVPTYQEIIAQYDAMVAATAAANGAIAATYSSSSTYKVGDYCIHDGGLYRCTTAITTAEAWTSGHWTAAKIGPDVSDLKSAVTDLEINTLNGSILGFGDNKYTFELGGISSATGADTSSNTRIRTNMFWATKNTKFDVPTAGDADLYAFFYDTDGTFLHETSGGWVKSYTVTKKCIARIVMRKNSSNDQILPSEVDDISGTLTIAVPSMEPIPLSSDYVPLLSNTDSLDALLTPGTWAIQTREIAIALNAPIDQPGRLIVIQTSQTTRLAQFYISNTSKTRVAIRFYNGSWYSWNELYNTSDKNDIIQSVLSVFLPKMDAYRFDWTIGMTISGAGTEIANTKWATTDIVKIDAGNIIINETPDTALNNKGTAFHVAAYKGSVFYERVQLTNGDIYQIPEDVTGIRIIYGFPTSTQDAPAMSMPILDDYFMVRMANFVQPTNYIGDGEHPAYVAFGASTTVGAVHHYDGEDITYSAYAFPEYLGRVLNLKTYNLGLGSTGIMNRTVTRGNFMDQIYNNADILSRAKLVTLMFGYGNDHYVGAEGDQIEFPVGSYDDYYPYDAEGYHPSGMAGCKTMVQMGATFMGCLNWCIKWINEHYPYAQLICIFGSPSANMDRSIALTAQTGSTGIAPYKMTFADPYSTAEAHTTNYMINQINTEINKLAPKLDVPIVNLFFGGNCFSWYSTYAKKPDNSSEYALFSTKGTQESPEWNSHPNDAGYLYYARFIAGKVAALFVH